MRYTLLTLSLSLALVGCQPATETPSHSGSPPVTAEQLQQESERLTRWFDEQYEQQLQTSPLRLTFLGRKDRQHEVDDMSIAAQDKQLAWLQASVEQLQQRFDRTLLTDDAKLSYDLWIHQYESQRDAARFRHHNYIFNQMQGIHSLLPQILMNFHQVDTKEDMQAYIQRIQGISVAIHQLLEQAQQNTESGIRPPRFAYEGVIEQVENLLRGVPFSDDSEQDAPLWQNAQQKITALQQQEIITGEDASQLHSEAKQQLIEHFEPAYQALLNWLQDDIEHAEYNPTGVSSHPDGDAYYRHQLRVSTTTDMTAAEIHQLGLQEVERLTAEMLAIKNDVGFDGDLHQFFEFIRTDDRFFYPDTDEGRQGYITDSEKFLAFINERLPDYFGVLPKADLVVKRVEAFREQPGAAQHYFPGTPDGSRPGVYYAHLSDMRAMPKNEMEAIAYHEGNPGHHMQISIAQELENIPIFRTQASFTVFAEGWALYSELLAKEMGAYQDPYSDFGRLVTEIWRAVRLVVDTGLHAKGWTEQQAIDYFNEHTPIPAEAVRSEVRRYLVMPGQATSYKIGMIRIQQLRAKAEEQLGDRFDIRAFHDTVLGGGALPLDLLERRIDEWIASVQSAA
ncbi:DUF885 domain-containing protein [Alkalimonas collagenimarina]|uniref:DUF885 domain-containing protein n=1 Tax=Alkalimonas collagenimarina TaxID=400390 RepID=A0ABT9H2W0_9GAMM|nr:DUF885 domain-containing protein [Alkalimonas collagenimarina]MDP4537634.1 DUF885 domain-containing protein [Alkalimonas collagenimarina]